LSTASPLVGKFFTRTVLPAIFTTIIWRKYPKSRKPLSRFLFLLICVYLVSVTHGLPAMPFERLFKFLNIAYRQKNRIRRTTPTTGSLGAVVYALIEPLIPVINTQSLVPVHNLKHVTPSSPAPSQASTMEPSIPCL
jgi:hypothetical protein